LENIKLRKELGLNTIVELLKIDNPDLSDEDAEAKAKEIMEEKKSRRDQMIGDMLKSQPSNLKPGGEDNGEKEMQTQTEETEVNDAGEK
jgi:hypothetical protein